MTQSKLKIFLILGLGGVIFLLCFFYLFFVTIPRNFNSDKLIKEIESPNKVWICAVYRSYPWTFLGGYGDSYVNLRKFGEKLVMRRYKSFFSSEILEDESNIFIIAGDAISRIKWKSDNQLEVSLPPCVFKYIKDKHCVSKKDTGISKMGTEWNGVKISYDEGSEKIMPEFFKDVPNNFETMMRK